MVVPPGGGAVSYERGTPVCVAAGKRAAWPGRERVLAGQRAASLFALRGTPAKGTERLRSKISRQASMARGGNTALIALLPGRGRTLAVRCRGRSQAAHARRGRRQARVLATDERGRSVHILDGVGRADVPSLHVLPVDLPHLIDVLSDVLPPLGGFLVFQQAIH